jgi:hypothetical protein
VLFAFGHTLGVRLVQAIDFVAVGFLLQQYFLEQFKCILMQAWREFGSHLISGERLVLGE